MGAGEGSSEALGKKAKRKLVLEDEVPSLLDAMSLLHPGVMLLHTLGVEAPNGLMKTFKELGYSTKKETVGSTAMLP